MFPNLGRVPDVHAGRVLVAVSCHRDEPIPGISTSWKRGGPGRLGGRHAVQLQPQLVRLLRAGSLASRGSRLTLTYGLRYDFEHYPSRYITRTDCNNVQPRVGAAFAYSPRGVIRAGYGIFNDRLASSIGQLFNATEWSSGGYLAERAALFPTIRPSRAGSSSAPSAAPRRPPRRATFLATGQVPAAAQRAGRHARRRNRHAVQPPGQRAGHAGDRPGMGGVGGYLFVGARDIIGHTGNLNALQTGTLATGKPILGGRTVPGGRRALRPDQHRRVVVSRRRRSRSRNGSAAGTACTAATRCRKRAPTSIRSPTCPTFPRGRTSTSSAARRGRTWDIASRWRRSARCRDGPRRRRREGQRAGDARERTSLQHLRRQRRRTPTATRTPIDRASKAATRTKGPATPASNLRSRVSSRSADARASRSASTSSTCSTA